MTVGSMSSAVFVQDDWRVNKSLVLNLGARYDNYLVVKIKPTTGTPAEIVNLEPATDLRKMISVRSAIR
jgi:outer membrane receptor protein involved in Fe transport